MANSDVLTLTGCFPGATGTTDITGPGVATTWVAPANVDYNVDDGYLAIPINSIRYTGATPNHFTQNAAGTSLTDVKGIGDSAGTSTGSFRAFARGMHESWSRYTAEALTGDNAVSKWNETSGSYSVANSATLSRQYATTLYYKIDSTELDTGF